MRLQPFMFSSLSATSGGLRILGPAAISNQISLSHRSASHWQRMSSSVSATPFSEGQADIGHVDAEASVDKRNQYNSYLPEGTSWRLLLERSSAKSRKIRGSNYVQLATVDSGSNTPKCRCVVFRGFLPLPNDHDLNNVCDELPCIMKMITDLRSQKALQLAQQATAEMVWWFSKTSEQYRVSGQVILIGGETTTTTTPNSNPFPYNTDKALVAARKEMWNSISDASRESFLSSEVPGQSWSPDSSGVSPPPCGRDPNGKLLPPPDNFLLMLLLPTSVDYLRLTNMYRQVDQREVDGSWTSQRLNP